MKAKLLLLCCLFLFGAAMRASGQQSSRLTCAAGPETTFQDDLLDKLIGNWSLTGTMMGGELLQECSGQWVFHHKFLRLDCRETKKPPLLGVRYESTMFIGCSGASQRYVVNLMDIFGASDSLGFGQRTGNAIRFVWDYPGGAFENTFTWNPESGTWTSSLRQKDRSGKWSPWGEKTMRRQR